MRYFFSLFLFLTSASLSARTFPSINAVIDELFHKYDVPASTNARSLHFAKKPEGWFVQWTDLNKIPSPVLEEELFWSAKKGKYEKLSFPPAGMSKDSPIEKTLLSFGDNYSYTRIPYYGYAGWNKDVIAEFGGKKTLTDTLLEGLGRAYDNYAFSFVGHAYDSNSPFPGLDEKMKLDSFVRYAQLSIATYDRLRKQNMSYEMFAGTSPTKYANEVIAFYDELVLHGKESIALPYFAEELYDPVILAAAANQLASCRPDAILFTNGDNDHYPLEYLQVAKGIRTDITVMNLSLMNLAYVLEQASKGKGKAKPVKFTFPMENYARPACDYLLSGEMAAEPASLQDFMAGIHLQDDNYSFPQSLVRFPVAASWFPEMENPVPAADAAVLIGPHYLLRSDLAQLDILLTNLETRPVYYTITTGDPTLNIKDFLFSEGMIYRFIPLHAKGGNKQLMYGQNVIPQTAYDNLLNIQLHNSPFTDKITGGMFVTNFRVQHIMLAYLFTSEHPEKSIRLLDRCDSLFPPSQWKYDPVCAYGVQAYYEAGQKIKGDQMALKLFEAFDKSLHNAKTPPDETEKSTMKAAIGIIKSIADDFNRPEIIVAADQLLEELE